MKRLFFILLFLLIPQMVLAEETPQVEEQLIRRHIDSGYYAIWTVNPNPKNDHYMAQEADGSITKGLKIDPDGAYSPFTPSHVKTKIPTQFTPPINLNYWKITRIEIKNPVDLSKSYDGTTYMKDAINNAFDPDPNKKKTAIWNTDSVNNYIKYLTYYLTPIGDNYNITKVNEDLETGKVGIKYDFDLHPMGWTDATTRWPVNVCNRPDAIKYVPTWDTSPYNPAVSGALRGFLFTTPIIIEWYGVPKGQVDLKAEFKQKEFVVTPGTEITSEVTFTRVDTEDKEAEAALFLNHRTSQDWPVSLIPLKPEDAPFKNDMGNDKVKFKPGESKTYQYKVTAQPRDTELHSLVEPDFGDSNPADNADMAKIIVIMPNLKVDHIVPGPDEPKSGETYTGEVIYANDENLQVNDIEVGTWVNDNRVNMWDTEDCKVIHKEEDRHGYRDRDMSGYRNSYYVVEKYDRYLLYPFKTKINLPPKGSVKMNFLWKHTGGQTSMMTCIDTPPLTNKIVEKTEEDNKVETIVEKVEPWTPDPAITWIVAKSQDGKITRPGGTAKWTDKISLKIKGEKPPVPKSGCHQGGIRDWYISEAKVVFPKKHPNFTFGNPVEPSGTVVLAMQPSDKTASVTFTQDWSMAGAGIYSPILRKKMAEKPKYYDIEIQYTVDYDYVYTTPKSCNSKDCHSHHHDRKYGHDRWTAPPIKAKLLVDGTGVIVRGM